MVTDLAGFTDYWFAIKSYLLAFIIIWVRGTQPRLRMDQLMNFAWKGLLPLALINILIAAAEVWIFGGWFTA